MSDIDETVRQLKEATSATPLSDAIEEVLKRFPPRPDDEVHTVWFDCIISPGFWCRGLVQGKTHGICIMTAGPLKASNA